MLALRSIPDAQREERKAVWLVLFVVLAAALATGLLEEQDEPGQRETSGATQASR